MTQILAVDGDIIAYRTASVCEEHFEKTCENLIDKTLCEISGDTGIHDMRIYLTSDCNFRSFIGTTWTYKGNRSGMVRPQYLGHCKDYLKSKYKALSVLGYEADDCIASDMVQNKAVHCGVDKDILQIAGLHYNYVTKDWREITEEEAAIILYRQVLMGDTSDNVPALPKVGEKRASDAVKSHATAHDDCLRMYREVCAKSLPDINADKYFMEQYCLISMVTAIKLPLDNTVHIRPWGLI